MGSGERKDCSHCWGHQRDQDTLACCGCGATKWAATYKADVPHHPQHAEGCPRTWQPAGLCDCDGWRGEKKERARR